MKVEAYEQYRAESQNWLKTARMRLLRAFLADFPAAGRRLQILEVGAGVGQNVPVIAEFGVVDVVEINPLGLDGLRESGNVREIYDQPIPFELAETYDVIVAFDVLEHIEDDRGATDWIRAHLRPGGQLIATVPAYQWLFSDHDVALRHYRRYTRRRLSAIMPAGMTVKRAGYFNCVLFPLAAAMRIVGKIAGKLSGRNSSQAVLKQSAEVPGFVDRVFLRVLSVELWAIKRGARLPYGLSVFCIAVKDGAA
jgi:SAM-dependent methyltransferase